MMGAFVAWMLLQLARHRLLVRAAPRAARRRRCFGIIIERTDARAPLQARPPLRPAAHLRPRADHPGPVPQRSTASPACPTPSRRSSPAARTSASCSCRTTAPGSSSPRSSSASPPGSSIENTQARRLPARRHREPDAGAGLRHQRAAADHADLRLRRRPRRLRRRAGGADLLGQPADGRRTSSSSCSPSW